MQIASIINSRITLCSIWSATLLLAAMTLYFSFIHFTNLYQLPSCACYHLKHWWYKMNNLDMLSTLLKLTFQLLSYSSEFSKSPSLDPLFLLICLIYASPKPHHFSFSNIHLYSSLSYSFSPHLPPRWSVMTFDPTNDFWSHKCLSNKWIYDFPSTGYNYSTYTVIFIQNVDCYITHKWNEEEVFCPHDK